MLITVVLGPCVHAMVMWLSLKIIYSSVLLPLPARITPLVFLLPMMIPLMMVLVLMMLVLRMMVTTMMVQDAARWNQRRRLRAWR